MKYEELAKQMKRMEERGNSSIFINGFGKVSDRLIYDEFLAEFEMFKKVNIVKNFLKDLGWGEYQINIIMAGPGHLNEISEYTKNNISVQAITSSAMESMTEILNDIEKLNKFIDSPPDDRSAREQRRHPEKFSATRYKRHKKGEKYYG